jgi:uncharacterized protein
MPRATVISALFTAFFLVFHPACATEEAGSTPSFWHATKGNDSVFILGTIHLGDQSLYPLPANVMEAFTGSEALAVEADISDPQQVMPLLKKGVYLAGDDITKHLRPETLERLRHHCEEKKLGFDGMKSFKPWFLSMSLMIMDVHALGYSEALGIDLHLLKGAKALKKPIIGLEGIAAQVDMFENLDQDFFVGLTLDPDMAEKTSQLIDAWKHGDTATLENLSLTEPEKQHAEMVKMNEKFIYARNDDMTTSLLGHLQERDSIFLAVGAAHLLGPRGIPALLRAEGFSVELVATAPLARP